MIISIDEILRLVKEEKLVENLCERELKDPEGAGFDIRVGNIYKINSCGYLGVEERDTSNTELIAEYGKQKEYILKPNEYVLIKTMEKVNLPKNLVMLTFPRSSLHRCGVFLIATQTAPGYKGGLIFGLKNICDKEFRLELGARVAHIMFFEVKGKGNLYRGQWQGGRISTESLEKQI